MSQQAQYDYSRKKRGRFNSQTEGLRMATKVWECKLCGADHPVPPQQFHTCKKCDTRLPSHQKQCLCGNKTWKSNKPRVCKVCRKDDFYYFASMTEWRFFVKLKQHRDMGLIKNIKIGVRIPLKINGHNCGTYVLDFMYHDKNDKRYAIDTKGSKKGETVLYKLKCDIVFALYKIKVQSHYGD